MTEMTREPYSPATSFFSTPEMIDIMAAAEERGTDPRQLIHDAVMDSLYR